MTSKALKTFDVNQTKEIAIADLNAGIYILKAEGSGNSVKVIKE